MYSKNRTYNGGGNRVKYSTSTNQGSYQSHDHFGAEIALIRKEYHHHLERTERIMAIARMLPTNLFFIPEFSTLYDSSKLAYIGLLLHADDEGRGCAEPRTLARAIDSYESDVQRSLEKLAESGFIITYTVDNKEYYQIKDWGKMQVIRYPHTSTYPPPPESEPETEMPIMTVTATQNHQPTASAPSPAPTPSNTTTTNNISKEITITTSSSSGEGKEAQTPNEETLMSLLGCSQQAAADLIAEFPLPTFNIVGECWAASDWYKSRNMQPVSAGPGPHLSPGRSHAFSDPARRVLSARPSIFTSAVNGVPPPLSLAQRAGTSRGRLRGPPCGSGAWGNA